MKTIFSVGNGVLTLTEDQGAFTLSINAGANAGGGKAAGVVSVKDSGSIVLEGKQAFDLGMAVLEAHSPAALLPIEEIGQAAADVAITQN